MIRIRLDNSKIKRLKESHRQILQSPFEVSKLLEVAIENNKNDFEKLAFYKIVKKKLHSILFGNISVLKRIVSEIEPLYESAALINTVAFKKEISDIFDYDKFSARLSGWGAYALTDLYDVRVCPYCNRISTVVVNEPEERGRTRPRLDHWLGRKDYPYLALSLFNLIPCCHYCNSDFKNTHKFSFDGYIHPFIEGYEKEYKFKLRPYVDLEDISKEDHFSIYCDASGKPSNALSKRCENTLGVFRIVKSYDEEKATALEIIGKQKSFSRAFIEHLMDYKDEKTGKPAFKDERDVVEREFGIRLNIEDYGKQVYSKFKRDLADDLGLKHVLENPKKTK